jgi:hypothetical protein
VIRLNTLTLWAMCWVTPNGVGPMTTKQRDLRRYLFRGLVADADAKTPGLFVLTWREARLMWKGATVAAIMQTNKRAGLQ